jgi:hypothetical protein
MQCETALQKLITIKTNHSVKGGASSIILNECKSLKYKRLPPCRCPFRFSVSAENLYVHPCLHVCRVFQHIITTMALDLTVTTMTFGNIVAAMNLDKIAGCDTIVAFCC